MTTFFIIALVIAMAGSAMVLGPVLRTYFRGHEDDPQPGITVGTGVIVALLIPVAALVLYSRWTNWNWSSGGVAATAQTEEMHSMEEAVAGLEKRLRDQPDAVGHVAGIENQQAARRLEGHAAPVRSACRAWKEQRSL